MTDDVVRTWTPPSVRLRLLLVMFFLVANLFDCVATLDFIRQGSHELNPLVQPMLAFGAKHFVAWKMGVAFVAVAALAYRAGRHRSSWRILKAVTAVFAVLSAYYLAGYYLFPG